MNEKEVENLIYQYNNKSEEKFSGLSPFELHEMIHHPFGIKSPIQIQDNIDSQTLNLIPFFRICEEFLKIVQRDNFIKLTPLGALPKKVMVELYDYKFITESLIESGVSKLSREQDSIAIQNARYVCEIAKLVKKRDGKLTLTKNGEKSLENRESLFKLILSVFAFDFNWSVNDGYPDEPIAQYGNLYTIYLLLKYGNVSRENKFYTEKYLIVFEKFLDLFVDFDYSNPEIQFSNCYEVRSLYRFTDWFGLTITSDKKYGENNTTKATELLGKIFKYSPQKG